MVTALIITRAVHIAVSMLLAGIFTFDLVTLGFTRGPVSDDLHEIEGSLLRLAVWILVAALVSAALWFWLEVVSMTGLSFVDSFSARAWQIVLLETVFGHVWQLRLGLIATAFVLVASTLAQIKARRALIAVLWLVSIVFLVSLALISHAAAATMQPVGLLGDMIHLCAAGLWIGGFVPLAIFLAWVRASFSLSEMVPYVLPRFSTLSLCCVSVLVVSGISNSWLLVGSIYALFATPYGQLLLLKLALFAILVGFGARNRFLVKAKLPKAAADPNLLVQLRQNVVCEACLGVAVVVIVACLGVTPPARHP
jgi:putative copper resistance protein D